MPPAGFDTAQARDYVLGIGANLGSRVATIRAARMLLDDDPAITVTAVSSVYESEALGPPGPPYLNLAIRVSTDLDPDALWAKLAQVETSLGRERGERWAARTLDLDVLWCAEPLRTQHLEVPHRELEQRWFAVGPLLEVAPECEARYRPVLEALGGMPVAGHPLDALAETRAVATQDEVLRFESLAADDADALATAIGAFGMTCATDGQAALRVQAVRAESADGDAAGAFVRALLSLVARGRIPTAVALCSLDDDRADGRIVLREGAPAAWSLVAAERAPTPRGSRVGLAFSRRITDG